MDNSLRPLALAGRLLQSRYREPLLRAANRAVRSGTARRFLIGASRLMLSALRWARVSRFTLEHAVMADAVLRTLDRLIRRGAFPAEASRRALELWGRTLCVRSSSLSGGRKFRERHGCEPPLALVISPAHRCNLRCPGCYSASGADAGELSRTELDRVLREAQDLWSVPLVAISGGEPFGYESQGSDIIEASLAHPDCLFVIFTNGTLLTPEKLERMSALRHNTAVVFAVDGLPERTDAVRGRGVSAIARSSLETLRDMGVPVAVSATVDRANWKELLSDRFIDLYFEELGVFCGFFFLYLPVGRSSDAGLMLSPEERLEFWRRGWELMERRGIVLFDFWHFGTQVGGCFAGGRERGLLHIDWEGRVSPCVFAPYAAADLRAVYAAGGTLDDVWDAPLLSAIREWQRAYAAGGRSNLLACCPVRDHHPEFMEMVERCGAPPLYETGRTSARDGAWRCAMARQGELFSAISAETWRSEYLRSR
ncbi:MAG: radical SAM protein [Candidatus Geothermincolia bacterium]